MISGLQKTRAARIRVVEILAVCGILFSLAILTHGCKSGGSEDPILRMSADEAFEEGQSLMERKKYQQAVEYLEHAFEVAPNSNVGRQALLLAADALYLDGGTANFIKAEAKYRDFQNRFPTSDRGDYVQLQIANCLIEQVLRPDRDQTATRKALLAYNDLLRIYPTSEFAEQAQLGIDALRERLGDHEYIIGRYNYKRRLYSAAESRLQGLLDEYPNYEESDKVLFLLGRSQLKQGHYEDAEGTFQRLQTEYPDSSYSRKIPHVPDVPPEASEEQSAEDEEESTQSSEEGSGTENDS